MKHRRFNKHILRSDAQHRRDEDDFPDMIPEIKSKATTEVDRD